MARKIALENTLTSFAPYLEKKGYRVKILNSVASYPLEGFDAVVVSGQSHNFLNMQETVTRAPVIDATGLSSEQVYQSVKRILED